MTHSRYSSAHSCDSFVYYYYYYLSKTRRTKQGATAFVQKMMKSFTYFSLTPTMTQSHARRWKCLQINSLAIMKSWRFCTTKAFQNVFVGWVPQRSHHFHLFIQNVNWTRRQWDVKIFAFAIKIPKRKKESNVMRSTHTHQWIICTEIHMIQKTYQQSTQRQTVHCLHPKRSS